MPRHIRPTAMIKRKPLTVENATVRIETLCARSEQCTSEVVQKLRQWGVSEADVRSIVRSLRERRFVDDARYAEAFVRDKVVFNRWGRVKIRQALRMKRIADDYIDAAMDMIAESEYRGNLLAALRSKARMMDDSRSYEGRNKLLRFGLSRGFEAALVIKVIKSGEIWGDVED